MIAGSLRRPLALTCRRCLAAATLPTLAAALAAVLLQQTLTTPLPGLAAAPGAMTPWLHLPLLVAAFACAARAAAFWPLFAARRPGADQVARLQRGPWRGCGAAVAGALLAQLVLTLPLTLLFARWLGAPATATAHVALSPPPAPLLDAGRSRLEFAVGGRVLGELQLRPFAAPPAGAWQATRVRVRLDGEPAPDELVFEQTLQLARLALPARAVDTLALEFVAGTVPLLFPRGTVVAVEAHARAGSWNGVAAALTWLLPSFVALAFGLVCGTAAGLPTVLTAIGGLLCVQTIGGAGPADDAVLALLRGHWLGTVDTFSTWIPSLAAGSLAMIGGMLLRRRHTP
jgi:hypothetical protein